MYMMLILTRLLKKLDNVTLYTPLDVITLNPNPDY